MAVYKDVFGAVTADQSPLLSYQGDPAEVAHDFLQWHQRLFVALLREASNHRRLYPASLDCHKGMGWDESTAMRRGGWVDGVFACPSFTF